MRPIKLQPRKKSTFIRYLKDTSPNPINFIKGEIYLISANKNTTQIKCHACKGEIIIYHHEMSYYYNVGVDIKEKRIKYIFCPKCYHKYIRYKRFKGITASLSLIKIRNSK